MAHRFVEHTGEVELELEAASESGIFEAALGALAELVETDAAGEPASHRVDLAADDGALLLVDWLSELLFLAEVERFIPEQLASFELVDGRLQATVAGRRGRPRHLVKAVTLNRLELEHQGGLWHGRVVLDV